MSNVLIGQNEGLPNIKGSLNVYTWNNGDAIGAFSSEIFINKATEEGSDAKRTFTKVSFNANKSNPIYGKFDTVMVKNVSVRYWRRTS